MRMDEFQLQVQHHPKNNEKIVLWIHRVVNSEGNSFADRQGRVKLGPKHIELQQHNREGHLQ